jgi:hypothetical protein
MKKSTIPGGVEESARCLLLRIISAKSNPIMFKKSLLTLLAALSLAGALTAQAAKPTPTPSPTPTSSAPKRVQFRSATNNQITFFNPEIANDTNIVVVNGLGQVPSAPPTDTLGNQYQLALSINNTITQDSSFFSFSNGFIVLPVGTPQYTAIYYCPHIKSSGNNTINFPAAQPIKITVTELSGLQGIIDVTGSLANNNTIVPTNPNDLIITEITDYNYAAGIGYVPGFIFVGEPNNGIGEYPGGGTTDTSLTVAFQ